MAAQIFWGSWVLGICSLIHLVLIVWWVGLIKAHGRRINDTLPFFRILLPIGGTFALLVFSHTVQVWIWAVLLLWIGALPGIFEAIYFSLVTYTTIGYGDVVLSDAFKVFGAMASVTGLLNFGVSTAFLVGVIAKVLPNHLGTD